MQKHDKRLVLINTVSYIVFAEILCPIISRDLLDNNIISRETDNSTMLDQLVKKNKSEKPKAPNIIESCELVQMAFLSYHLPNSSIST